ncbi:MAG: glycosyltransferase, partial [Cyclobacteriaceae bacterium]|nr:glycosyltransferase [Cyclobacteriaceae bacterium]
RPDELNELLESLYVISDKPFEVIVVEDGSTISAKEVVEKHKSKLDILYLEKENTGQGFSRNYASEYAKGEYLVFFDSDCLIPETYFLQVVKAMNEGKLDFWGGPDASHSSFSNLQKAINYTMTSVFTTGGIRGGTNHAGTFQPRSFNMGIRKSLFDELGGFYQTNMGEDIELSTRLINKGVKPTLLEKAFVYHKRRNTLLSFLKQTYSFGKGRILTGRKNHGGIKIFHWFPSVFSVGVLITILTLFLFPFIGKLFAGCYIFYFVLLFFGSLISEKSLIVAVLSMVTGFTQLVGYGFGFLKEWTRSCSVLGNSH